MQAHSKPVHNIDMTSPHGVNSISTSGLPRGSYNKGGGRDGITVNLYGNGYGMTNQQLTNLVSKGVRQGNAALVDSSHRGLVQLAPSGA